MKTSDYFGFAVVLCFGLWWVVFPRSVIAFYTLFHRGSVKMPRESGIRVAGALWLFMVAIVAFIFSRARA
jgi:succinate-acetate transporter protein